MSSADNEGVDAPPGSNDNDEKTIADLIQTLEDGKNGFATAAEKLSDASTPELANRFKAFSAQRAQFVQELDAFSGQSTSERGSVGGVLHRSWLALKDAVSGSAPDGVIEAAEQGEDHALAVYDKALGEDLSDGLRTIVERQYTEVRAAHDAVRAMRDSLT